MNQTQQVLKQAEQYLIDGQHVKALDLYDIALTTNPDDLHLRYCVASIYSEMYKPGIAISMLKQVVKEEPRHAQAWNNLGIAYKNSGQWDLAFSAYSKALELNYDPNTLVNMSGLYINNATPDEAVRLANKGLKLAPGVPQLKNHRALGLLEAGQFEQGFKEYEARFGLPGWTNRNYAGPMWDGKSVQKLLIHGEQGLGDELLFLGALERVRPLAKEIIIECAERLVPLLSANFPDIKFYATADEIKAKESWSAWVPMGSLFSLVGHAPAKPYLKSSKPYPKSGKFRIGLSWRGGTVQTHEHLRNFDIEWWKPLLEFDAEFISVQYGPAAGMAKQIGIPHDEATIADFDALTGMIESCDLVISVCNTAVHQAAATGTPCWVVVPSKPSWQFQLIGDTMPFWEVPKLFRQEPGEDWRAVIQRIKNELERTGIAAKLKAA